MTQRPRPTHAENRPGAAAPPRRHRALHLRSAITLAATTCLAATAIALPAAHADTRGPAAGPDASSPHYATNPGGSLGEATAVTVDGDAAEWGPGTLIAQGVANDDPRIFRGSHEGPVYDLYSLSAAWDESNLYLMWQYTNVTDVADPAQDYPISDNGKPYSGDIPVSIAFDADPTAGTDGLVDGGPGGVWGLLDSWENAEVDHLANFSAKPGVGEPALFGLNAEGAFDYEPENVAGFEEAGVEYAYADGQTAETVLGVPDTGNAGYVPADLADENLYTDLLSEGHDPEQDTVYEMAVPLDALGLTRQTLESDGIGVMIVSTFGESAIESLPHDPAVLDAATDPYSADESTSAEKEDEDVFSVPFARIGAE